MTRKIYSAVLYSFISVTALLAEVVPPSLPPQAPKVVETAPPSGVQLSDWRMARVLKFDGIDDHVRVADDPSLRPTCFTLTAWVKTTDADAQQPILAKSQSAGNWCSYLLRIQPGGRLSLAVENSEGDRCAHWTTREKLPSGKWRHLAATWSNAAGNASDAKIFIDGVEQELELTLVRNYDRSFCIGYTTEPLYIGRDQFPTGHFRGTIAHADVIDRVLTAKEIVAIKDRGIEE